MRPAVTVAFAQSMNGTISREKGKPTKISCPESDAFTHMLRGLHDAIGVGVGTVLADDPRLTCRDGSGNSPMPVIFDGRLRTSPEARLFREHSTVLLLCSEEAFRRRGREYNERVARCIPLLNSNRAETLHTALGALRERFSIRSLMVEGGGSLIHSFLSARLFDLLAVTISPRILGGYHIGSEIGLDLPLEIEEWKLLGKDLLVLARRGAEDE
ncbi:MAG: RibD family protein [Spirochaetaceae bacterium]